MSLCLKNISKISRFFFDNSSKKINLVRSLQREPHIEAKKIPIFIVSRFLVRIHVLFYRNITTAAALFFGNVAVFYCYPKMFNSNNRTR